jgi:hypothetical protein
MNRFTQTVLAVSTLIGVLALAFFLVPSAESSAQTGCSNGTLSGNYIYGYDGFEVADGQNLPFAYSGRETYDGMGAMQGQFSGIDSTGVTEFATYPGVYAVNEDCTGTLTTDPGTDGELNFNIFVNETTGDFYFTEVDAGFITQGFNQKIQ